jgi:hypothetical protein
MRQKSTRYQFSASPLPCGIPRKRWAGVRQRFGIEWLRAYTRARVRGPDAKGGPRNFSRPSPSGRVFPVPAGTVSRRRRRNLRAISGKQHLTRARAHTWVPQGRRSPTLARHCLPPLAPHFPRTCARVQDALWGVRKLVGVSVNAMDSLTPTQRSAHMSGFAARTRNPGSMRWPALRCWPRSSRRSGCVRRRPRWRQGSARRLIGGGGGRGRSLLG